VKRPPSPDPWAAEQSIIALLCKCKIDADEIPPHQFFLVAARISQFKQRPATKCDMAEMTRIGRKQRGQRKILNQAVKVLRSEVENGRWRDIPSMGEHERRWGDAIAVLQMPRGALDNPYDWLRIERQGPAMQPWSYMAVEIAACLMPVLKGYRTSASLQPAGGVTKFTQEALRFIGVNKLPALTTISKVLRKKLQNLPTPSGRRVKPVFCQEIGVRRPQHGSNHVIGCPPNTRTATNDTDSD
jgi:hypothetical protein